MAEETEHVDPPATEVVLAMAMVTLKADSGAKIPPGQYVEVEVDVDTGNPVEALELGYRDRKYITLPGDPGYQTPEGADQGNATDGGAVSEPPPSDPEPSASDDEQKIADNELTPSEIAAAAAEAADNDDPFGA